MENKQRRSANFSFAERSNLIKVVLKYKDIVENKKTDALTWRQKEDVWNTIENEFNANSNGEVSVQQHVKWILKPY